MFISNKVRYSSVVLSLILGAISANAAEEYRLDTAVVSASGFSQDIKEAPR